MGGSLALVRSSATHWSPCRAIWSTSASPSTWTATARVRCARFGGFQRRHWAPNAATLALPASSKTYRSKQSRPMATDNAVGVPETRFRSDVRPTLFIDVDGVLLRRRQPGVFDATAARHQ